MNDTARVKPKLTRWVMMVVVGAFLPSGAMAGDVGDIFWGVNLPPNMIDQRVYGATVRGAIFTACPPVSTAPCTPQPTSDWSGSNILTGTLTGTRGDSLSFSGTRSQFESFAKNNADQIIRILFPSDPEGSMQGVPGGPAVALFSFDALVTTPVSPTPSEFAALKGERMRRFAPIDGPPTFQALGLFEGESFDTHGTTGTNFKLAPGFGFNIGKLQLGVLAPLLYGNLNDTLHTTSYTFGLNLNAKYDVELKSQEWVLSPLGGAFANTFLFTSDDIDLSGYIRYGGYVGLATRAAVGPLFLTGGVLYSVSTISIPSNLVPDDVQPLAGALTDRPVDQQITFGAKIGARLGQLGLPGLENFVANMGAIYVQTIGPSAVEPGLRSFTQGQVSLMYSRGGLGVEVGYKHIFGADNLQSNAGFLNVLYQF